MNESREHIEDATADTYKQVLEQILSESNVKELNYDPTLIRQALGRVHRLAKVVLEKKE